MLNRTLRWAAGLIAVIASCGCGSDDSEAASSPSGSADLADARVDYGPSGLALSVGDRPLITLAKDAPFRVKRFEQTAQSFFGMFELERFDETRVDLTGPRSAKQTADGVTLTYAGAGRELTLDFAPLRAGATQITLTLAGAEEDDSLALPLACDAEASFYGFGEQYNATDQRGEAFPLFVSEQGIGRDGQPGVASLTGNAHTTYYPMPYFLDARGFGVLLQTHERTLVDLCQSDSQVAWLEVESTAPTSLVVFHGPTPKDVIRQLGDEVGRPSAPPSWAYGLWIGAQGGRDAVLAEADALEAANIPAKALWVQDWTGPRTNAGGGYGVQYRWVADEQYYPELSTMIADLKQRDLRFLGYVNPFVMPKLDHFQGLDAAGYLIQSSSGETLLHPSPAGDASHADLSSDAARAAVQAILAKIVTDLGMDGWMADFGEWIPLEVVPQDGSTAPAFHNRYPELWHQVCRDALSEARPNGDWILFSRSGWTGDHAAAQIVWAGDQEATFSETDGLPTVVPALLNLGLSGLPFVTHDIAGFSGGPSEKELFLRWTELGAFTPIMRTHEGNNREENWSWEKDAETTAHFRRFALIHQVLAPELEALAKEAAESGTPLVRHLMLEHPDDPALRGVSDQYLLGPDLLVAPVLTEGATSREVVFPEGTWFNVWTGESVTGGQTLSIDAPIGSPPVFSRGKDRTDLRAVQ